MTVTHMDSLSHFSYDGKLYNYRDVATQITPNGAKWGSIYAQKNGIFTRGVLLDVAAVRGVPWYVSDEYVTVADFEAAEKRQNLKVGSGDAIFVRTGMEAMEKALGEQDIYPRAGLHAECVEWMQGARRAEHGVGAVTPTTRSVFFDLFEGGAATELEMRSTLLLRFREWLAPSGREASAARLPA